MRCASPATTALLDISARRAHEHRCAFCAPPIPRLASGYTLGCHGDFRKTAGCLGELVQPFARRQIRMTKERENMPYLLRIDSSASGAESISRRVADTFVDS